MDGADMASALVYLILGATVTCPIWLPPIIFRYVEGDSDVVRGDDRGLF